MSFFDDASLVFLPSGQAGKDGKAYSMKPTNGDGDFTFSRGSNLTATRVDSNGLIEKGRENLLLKVMILVNGQQERIQEHRDIMVMMEAMMLG